MENNESYADFLNYLEINQNLEEIFPAILANSDKFYRSFKIKKRSGGFRIIDSPYPSLALIQDKIAKKILSLAFTHASAFAYRKKTNAIQHAALHLGCNELLLLDIKDFFPSISRQMIFESLETLGLPNKFCYFVSLLCSRNGWLPQGACTSPALSNIIFASLDERFRRLAQSLELKYSRYADDLAFSGERIPRSLVEIIREILESKNFEINKSKTRLKLSGAKKIITGVSISSGALKAPRQFKRTLRAEIYELEKYSGNLAKMRSLDPMIYERLIGKINYLLQIEPDNLYAQTKKIILSDRHQKFLGLV